MPDAFYRLLAFPNGFAMIALGWSLWHSTHVTDAPTGAAVVPGTTESVLAETSIR